jgi:hypothetical protein
VLTTIVSLRQYPGIFYHCGFSKAVSDNTFYITFMVYISAKTITNHLCYKFFDIHNLIFAIVQNGGFSLAFIP